MKAVIAISTALLMAMTLSMTGLAAEEDEAAKDKEGQEIVLDVYGVECAGCARVLTAALEEGGIEESSRLAPGRDKAEPVRVEARLGEEADLAKAAAAINEAETPHRAKSPPGLALVLFAEVDDQAAEKIAEALEPVKGVDAKKSKANAEEGEIRLKLTGKEKVTLAEIMDALEQAGIEAKATKKKQA